MRWYTYDLEVFPNCFTYTGKFLGEDKLYVFEISSRMNQRTELLSHLNYLQNCGAMMVGFNSLGFDYPILHQLLMDPYTWDFTKAHHLCQQIIEGQGYGSNHHHTISMSKRIIPQLDLVKLNHFDNANRRVSLKTLEFNMRLHSVEDLPFPPNTMLEPHEMDVLKEYNAYDVYATEMFLRRCQPAIKMRETLLSNGVLTGDVLNFSDVKIGKEYLIKKIGRSKCFIKGSTPRRSVREVVQIKDVILPKIQFRSEEYQVVKDWFSQQVVYPQAKGGKKPKLEVNLADIPFVFGLGGVHASVTNKVYKTSDTHMILDIDVTGMYVSVGIANKYYPEHLGQAFVTAYGQLKGDRDNYKKGTPLNSTLKLAGNGVYGDSNNKYSPFFDPKYTYSVTVTGQLQLLQLVEMIHTIPGLEVIQANTDGITVYMRRDLLHFFRMWTSEWEKSTGLQLEEVEYSAMWIRDCNSYVAEYIDEA